MSRRRFLRAGALVLASSGLVACAAAETSPSATNAPDDRDGESSRVDAGPSGPVDEETTLDDQGRVSCTAAAKELLAPIDKVSEGSVRVLSDDGVLFTLFVDATAKGPTGQAQNPRIYVNLETGTRVDVTDESAKSSIDWDISLKRAILFTNGGQGGPGWGGATFVTDKSFEAITRADAEAAPYGTETFLNDACEASVDQTGALKTAFDGWYDYDIATHILTPKAGTWLVKGAAGAYFKLRIKTYYAKDDGDPGGASGRYVLESVTL